MSASENEAILRQLQTRLAGWYEIDPPCAVDQFLITDRSTVEAINPDAVKRDAREQLIVAEQPDELNVALYLEARLLDELRQMGEVPPSSRQLDTLWMAVEGVSHFLHLTWRATRRRPISQLELELQAEIDKYLYTYQWLCEHRHTRYLPALHGLLFELTELHGSLQPREAQRYVTANRYAAKYCRKLYRRPDHQLSAEELNGLRRFYRLSQYEKLRYIDMLN